MDTEQAFEIALWEGSSHRQYAEALEHLVELAALVCTGREQKKEGRKRTSLISIVEKTKPEYLIAAPDSLDSIAIDMRKKNAEELAQRYRDEGMIVIPYRYSAYYEGDQMMVAQGNNLAGKLCTCLHEKRHSKRAEGGLDQTRLDRNYFEEDTSNGERIAEGGLIEEAACDAMAYYDMLVLSHLTSKPEFKEELRQCVISSKSSDTRLRHLIEARRKALTENAQEARLLLIRFGHQISDTEIEEGLYERLEEALGKGDEGRLASIKTRLATLMKKAQPEASRLILTGECDLENLLHCQMAHYAHYSNNTVDPLVKKVMAYVAPPPAEVAAGRAKNPFIDLMAIHENLCDLEDTAAYASAVARLGERRLLSEVRKDATKLRRWPLVERYEGLRHLYVLAATARRKNIPLGENLERIANGNYSKAFGEDVERFISIFSTPH